ncbi:contact-dependent growth inhibition system immunity protein [Streptomyces sp. NPDC001941]|uniref:contact-dependent growth inhibition system immunity protein n=1 Tax=Streptomyces sp. NPDC001941 TaxID=3154659 RepID=UPI003326C8A9
MSKSRPTYAELGYGEDFGLTGLTELIHARADQPDLAGARALVARVADGSEGEEAAELGEDARRLLASPLSDATLHALWLAAVGARFDPAGHGMTAREWLEEVSDTASSRSRATPVRPVLDEDLCRAVASQVRATAAALVAAGAPGPLPEALAEAATRADADLGLRLLLRALKAYGVPVEPQQYERFQDLGERFGFPTRVAYDGLDVRWPPIDTAHRDPESDFGLPCLALHFIGGAHHGTGLDQITWLAGADAVGQPPGWAAAALWQDAARLLRSDLPADALTMLWVAATDRHHDPASWGMDPRDWLREVTRICEEHLRTVAPGYEPVLPPPDDTLTAPVLHELALLNAEFANRSVSPAWQPVPGDAVMASLRSLAAHVDADLALRLLLLLLSSLSVPLGPGQYERLKALGTQIGASSHRLMALEDQVRPTA